MLAQGPTCLSIRKVSLHGARTPGQCLGEAAQIIKDKEIGLEHHKPSHRHLPSPAGDASLRLRKVSPEECQGKGHVLSAATMALLDGDG